MEKVRELIRELESLYEANNPEIAADLNTIVNTMDPNAQPSLVAAELKAVFDDYIVHKLKSTVIPNWANSVRSEC